MRHLLVFSSADLAIYMLLTSVVHYGFDASLQFLSDSEMVDRYGDRCNDPANGSRRLILSADQTKTDVLVNNNFSGWKGGGGLASDEEDCERSLQYFRTGSDLPGILPGVANDIDRRKDVDAGDVDFEQYAPSSLPQAANFDESALRENADECEQKTTPIELFQLTVIIQSSTIVAAFVLYASMSLTRHTSFGRACEIYCLLALAALNTGTAAWRMSSSLSRVYLPEPKVSASQHNYSTDFHLTTPNVTSMVIESHFSKFPYLETTTTGLLYDYAGMVNRMSDSAAEQNAADSAEITITDVPDNGEEPTSSLRPGVGTLYVGSGVQLSAWLAFVDFLKLTGLPTFYLFLALCVGSASVITYYLVVRQIFTLSLLVGVCFFLAALCQYHRVYNEASFLLRSELYPMETVWLSPFARKAEQTKMQQLCRRKLNQRKQRSQHSRHPSENENKRSDSGDPRRIFKNNSSFDGNGRQGGERMFSEPSGKFGGSAESTPSFEDMNEVTQSLNSHTQPLIREDGRWETQATARQRVFLPVNLVSRFLDVVAHPTTSNSTSNGVRDGEKGSELPEEDMLALAEPDRTVITAEMSAKYDSKHGASPSPTESFGLATYQVSADLMEEGQGQYSATVEAKVRALSNADLTEVRVVADDENGHNCRNTREFEELVDGALEKFQAIHIRRTQKYFQFLHDKGTLGSRQANARWTAIKKLAIYPEILEWNGDRKPIEGGDFVKQSSKGRRRKRRNQRKRNEQREIRLLEQAVGQKDEELVKSWANSCMSSGERTSLEYDEKKNCTSVSGREGNGSTDSSPRVVWTGGDTKIQLLKEGSKLRLSQKWIRGKLQSASSLWASKERVKCESSKCISADPFGDNNIDASAGNYRFPRSSTGLYHEPRKLSRHQLGDSYFDLGATRHSTASSLAGRGDMRAWTSGVLTGADDGGRNPGRSKSLFQKGADWRGDYTKEESCQHDDGFILRRLIDAKEVNARMSIDRTMRRPRLVGNARSIREETIAIEDVLPPEGLRCGAMSLAVDEVTSSYQPLPIGSVQPLFDGGACTVRGSSSLVYPGGHTVTLSSQRIAHESASYATSSPTVLGISSPVGGSQWNSGSTIYLSRFHSCHTTKAFGTTKSTNVTRNPGSFDSILRNFNPPKTHSRGRGLNPSLVEFAADLTSYYGTEPQQSLPHYSEFSKPPRRVKSWNDTSHCSRASAVSAGGPFATAQPGRRSGAPQFSQNGVRTRVRRLSGGLLFRLPRSDKKRTVDDSPAATDGPRRTGGVSREERFHNRPSIWSAEALVAADLRRASRGAFNREAFKGSGSPKKSDTQSSSPFAKRRGTWGSARSTTSRSPIARYLFGGSGIDGPSDFHAKPRRTHFQEAAMPIADELLLGRSRRKSIPLHSPDLDLESRLSRQRSLHRTASGTATIQTVKVAVWGREPKKRKRIRSRNTKLAMARQEAVRRRGGDLPQRSNTKSFSVKRKLPPDERREYLEGSDPSRDKLPQLEREHMMKNIMKPSPTAAAGRGDGIENVRDYFSMLDDISPSEDEVEPCRPPCSRQLVNFDAKAASTAPKAEGALRRSVLKVLKLRVQPVSENATTRVATNEPTFPLDSTMKIQRFSEKRGIELERNGSPISRLFGQRRALSAGHGGWVHSLDGSLDSRSVVPCGRRRSATPRITPKIDSADSVIAAAESVREPSQNVETTLPVRKNHVTWNLAGQPIGVPENRENSNSENGGEHVRMADKFEDNDLFGDGRRLSRWLSSTSAGKIGWRPWESLKANSTASAADSRRRRWSGTASTKPDEQQEGDFAHGDACACLKKLCCRCASLMNNPPVLLGWSRFVIDCASWYGKGASFPQESACSMRWQEARYEAWFLGWHRAASVDKSLVLLKYQLITLFLNIVLLFTTQVIKQVDSEQPAGETPRVQYEWDAFGVLVLCAFVIADSCIISALHTARRNPLRYNQYSVLLGCSRFTICILILALRIHTRSMQDVTAFSPLIFNLFAYPLNVSLTSFLPTLLFIISWIAANAAFIGAAGGELRVRISLIARLNYCFFHAGAGAYGLHLRGEEQHRRRAFAVCVLPYLLELHDASEAKDQSS